MVSVYRYETGCKMHPYCMLYVLFNPTHSTSHSQCARFVIHRSDLPRVFEPCLSGLLHMFCCKQIPFMASWRMSSDESRETVKINGIITPKQSTRHPYAYNIEFTLHSYRISSCFTTGTVLSMRGRGRGHSQWESTCAETSITWFRRKVGLPNTCGWIMTQQSFY